MIAHVFYTFQQCREDLARWTKDLDAADVWRPPAAGLAPLGFQLRHMAGSAERLFTYLQGGALSAEQLAFLKAEMVAGAPLDELMAELDAVFARIEEGLRAVTAEQFTDERGVGRQGLPTTVGGLVVHIAEHTQRHLGQAVLTAKLLRESR